MRPLHLFAPVALAIAALVAPAVPATAAPVAVQSAVLAPTVVKASGKVTIKKIATKTVSKGKKTTIKPSYKKSGSVKIVSARLTVTKSGKNVAKNKISVRVGAGKYKVTQKISYKLLSGKRWGKTRTATLTQTLTVKSKAKTGKENAAGMPNGITFDKGYPKVVKISTIPVHMQYHFLTDGTSKAVAVAPGVWSALTPGATMGDSISAMVFDGFCASKKAFERKHLKGEETAGTCW